MISSCSMITDFSVSIISFFIMQGGFFDHGTVDGIHPNLPPQYVQNFSSVCTFLPQLGHLLVEPICDWCTMLYLMLALVAHFPVPPGSPPPTSLRCTTLSLTFTSTSPPPPKFLHITTESMMFTTYLFSITRISLATASKPQDGVH